MKKSVGLKTKTLECPTHGMQQVPAVALNGHEIGGRCPLCVKESEAGEQSRRRGVSVRTLLGRADIPPRYHDRSFENYRATMPAQNRVLRACRAFAAEFEARRRSGCSLVLSGSPGTGKTHLASAIGRHVIEQHGRFVLYTTTAAAMRFVKQTYRANARVAEFDALMRFQLPDLLILDEVGGNQGTDFELSLLGDVLNERYAHVKPTVLASNLSPDELTAYLGERTMDRFREGGGAVLTLEWPSYRAQVVKDDALTWPAVTPAGA